MVFSWLAEPGITAFKFLQTSGNMENETLVHFIIVVSLVTCPAQPLSYAHHCNGRASPQNDIVGDRLCAFCFSTLSSRMLPLAVWFPRLNSIVMETEKERGGERKTRSTPSLETTNAGLTQNNPPSLLHLSHLPCEAKLSRQSANGFGFSRRKTGGGGETCYKMQPSDSKHL